MARRWYRRTAVAVVVLMGLLFLAPMSAHAAQRMTGNDVTVPQSQTINDDLYIAAKTITINGKVNGNLVAMGQDIHINGTVTGSVLAAGNSLALNGSIGKDLTFAGNDLKINTESSVGRDVTYWGNAATIAGKVDRNVSAYTSETVKLASTATIGGAFHYTGSHKPAVPAGAQIVGATVQESGPVIEWPNWSVSFNPVAFGLLLWLRNLIGLLILGLLFVWLAPSLARRCTSEEQRAPFGTLGWGFLSLLVVPIVAVTGLVIGFFIGGWWIALMLMGIYWTAITIGAAVSALFVGQWLFARMHPATSSLALSLLLGMVVLGLLSLIPGLGQLVAFLAAVWGLGALTVVAYRAGPWNRRGAAQPVVVTPTPTMPPQGHPA